MLGEKVGSISGPTSMKAIPAVDGNPAFETVASGLTGTLAGTDVTSFATYSAAMRADSGSPKDIDLGKKNSAITYIWFR